MSRQGQLPNAFRGNKGKKIQQVSALRKHLVCVAPGRPLSASLSASSASRRRRPSHHLAKGLGPAE